MKAVCLRCKKEFSFEPKYGWIRKYCNACKNIRDQSKELKEKKGRKMQGKNNPMYGKPAWNKNLTMKTNESLKIQSEKTLKTYEAENIRISDMTFKKYNGICQDCKRNIFKNNWAAHHLNLKLIPGTKEYHKCKNRILLCTGCHRKRHIKINRTKTKSL